MWEWNTRQGSGLLRNHRGVGGSMLEGEAKSRYPEGMRKMLEERQAKRDRAETMKSGWLKANHTPWLAPCRCWNTDTCWLWSLSQTFSCPDEALESTGPGALGCRLCNNDVSPHLSHLSPQTLPQLFLSLVPSLKSSLEQHQIITISMTYKIQASEKQIWELSWPATPLIWLSCWGLISCLFPE